MIWLKIDYLLLYNNDSLTVSKFFKICHVAYPITCWCTDIVDSHVVGSNIYIFHAEIMLTFYTINEKVAYRWILTFVVLMNHEIHKN
jgi:hypothetical protein